MATPADENDWRLIEIEAGSAHIEAVHVGELLPQMLSYDTRGHVSFTKGCYTGQEVVARLHYRGTAKRQLCQASTTGTATPGTPLIAKHNHSIVGQVVNAARLNSGDYRMLAVVAKSAMEGEVLLGDANGPRLDIEPVPDSTL